MKPFLIALAVFLLWSIPGTWYYGCKIKMLCDPVAVVEETLPEPTPEPEPEPEPEPVVESFSNSTLYCGFAQVSFIQSTASISYLEELVGFLNRNPDRSITLIGHCDNIGSDSYNLALGERRADFTKNYLVSKGVDTNRINTSSKGESEPIGSNDTEDGRSQNRRVEIVIN